MSCAARPRTRQVRNVKTMDGVKKEERADAFVEIVAVAAEAVERCAFVEQLG